MSDDDVVYRLRDRLADPITGLIYTAAEVTNQTNNSTLDEQTRTFVHSFVADPKVSDETSNEAQ
jgi:hypothetical protein